MIFPWESDHGKVAQFVIFTILMVPFCRRSRGNLKRALADMKN